jgi:hypothetical protein
MPLLSYAAITDYPFQPFTKIYSTDINNMFATLTTLLNTTQLDYLNVKQYGLKRYGTASNVEQGTANSVLINDSSGNMADLALGTANQVLAVNNAGTAVGWTSSPITAADAIYLSQNYV